MTHYEATALYIGLHVLLMMFLKMRVGATRGREKVQFGDGGNENLIRSQRVQGNAVEDVPIILLGLVGLSSLSAPVALIHGIGAVLFVSRILHAWGLGGSTGFSIGRIAGSLGTVVSMLATGGACVWFAISRFFMGG
jgi:uncharacterized membrane protein YecN with MAPEG domain